MNKNQNLTQYLNEYLKMDRPQFAIMISGKWGCGKTYYIKNKIEEWAKPGEKVSDDEIELKPIYISVNGISSIASVVSKIKTQLHPLLYSKGAKVARKVVLAALNIVVKSKVDLDRDGTGEDLNSLLDSDGILGIFMSESSSVKGKRILILDDIERCKIPLDELFGFINGIVEHSNSKAILICDEEKLVDVAAKESLAISYKDFKEKLIGQTFVIKSDYVGITKEFISASKNEILQDNLDLIAEIFVASQFENLRLARHCLIDIARFFEQLPKGIEKKPNYKDFEKNVVAYLTIASLETRFGNEEVIYYQGYNYGGADKKTANEIENKYASLLQKYALFNSVYTIPLRNLVDFIKTGFIASPNRLIEECRMFKTGNLSNWEKLWNCSLLSNEEFQFLLKKEKQRFFNKELEYTFEVAHLAGILLSLERRKLIELSRSNIEKIAKSNIKKIKEKYPDDMGRMFLNSQGYEFHESGSKEMENIKAYAGSLFQEELNKKEAEYVINVWKELNDDSTCSWLNAKFEEATPDKHCAYSMKGIFFHVKPAYMAEKLAGLSNPAKIEFCKFLVGRYYLKGSCIRGEINGGMKIDKETIEKISAMLKSKAKKKKLIDKDNILLIASKLDEAVENINNSRY